MHPYEWLTPATVLDALDALGLRGDGRLLQLNSYENRVFQVFLEDGSVVVAKFYRPGRWSDAQIAEEHAFAAELEQVEIPVVAPLTLGTAGHTLHHTQLEGQTWRFAVYPRRAGRGPELDQSDTLRWLGRFIARLHGVGERQAFVHRRRLDPDTFGRQPLQRLLDMDCIDPGQLDAWRDTARHALHAVEAAFKHLGDHARLRLHGDCHPGNILWREEGPHIVDLDDACTGAAIQDLWMLLSGNREAMTAQLSAVLAGYRQFRALDMRELALIEPLRTLRMIHHSAWLAERWSDPAFPAAFPWFGTPGYWGQQTIQLREQIAAMAEPALDVAGLD